MTNRTSSRPRQEPWRQMSSFSCCPSGRSCPDGCRPRRGWRRAVPNSGYGGSARPWRTSGTLHVTQYLSSHPHGRPPIGCDTPHRSRPCGSSPLYVTDGEGEGRGPGATIARTTRGCHSNKGSHGTAPRPAYSALISGSTAGSADRRRASSVVRRASGPPAGRSTTICAVRTSSERARGYTIPRSPDRWDSVTPSTRGP